MEHIICQILLLPRHEDAGVKVVGKVTKDIMNFTEERMDTTSTSYMYLAASEYTDDERKQDG